MHRAAQSSLVLFIAGLIMASWPAQAQQADTGGIIGAINAGGLFGLGTHGAAGASLASPVTKYVVPFIEISYSPLISYGYTYGSNLTRQGLVLVKSVGSQWRNQDPFSEQGQLGAVCRTGSRRAALYVEHRYQRLRRYRIG